MKSKSRRKAPLWLTLTAALLSWTVWQFTPAQAVFAIANLSDPDKLATLGERRANPRLNKIVYWLEDASSKGLSPESAVRLAQWLNGTSEPRATLVKESLVRNFSIANELGLFTPENRTRLRNGRAAVVTRGPYARSNVEIDHIVPFSLAPEVGNELANLEMLPEPVNRRKSNRVGPRQLEHAQKLHAAGLLEDSSLAKLKKQAR